MAVPIPGEEDLGTDGFGTDATELHVDAAPVDLGAITEHQAEAVHASFVVMDVVDVSLLLPAQYPKVLLREAEAPFRALEFAVGLARARPSPRRSTAPHPRPLTHQLFANTLRAFSVDIVAVRLVAGWARTTAPRSICGRTGDARCSTAVPPTHWPWRCAKASLPRSWPTSGCSTRGRRQRPLRSGRNGEDAIARLGDAGDLFGLGGGPLVRMRSRMAIRT